MSNFHVNLNTETLSNTNFRKVLYTGTKLQLVVMSLEPGEEIGLETHETVDQFFRVEAGEGKLISGLGEIYFKEEDAFIVPAGTKHNVINTSEAAALKLYTIYAPPNHPEGTVHKTKKDAESAERGH